jgi:hypothetical protein
MMSFLTYIMGFFGFREEDLNVIFYQNMPNLHNWYKSVERKISQKSPEYMLNYSLPYEDGHQAKNRKKGGMQF